MKILKAIIILLLMVLMFLLGAKSVLASEGWIDFYRESFCIEWMGHVFEWEL